MGADLPASSRQGRTAGKGTRYDDEVRQLVERVALLLNHLQPSLRDDSQQFITFDGVHFELME